MIVNVSVPSRKFVNNDVVDAMFNGGLTPDLIDNLKILMIHVPAVRSHLQSTLRLHITSILLMYNVLVDEGPTGVAGASSPTPINSRITAASHAKQPTTSSSSSTSSTYGYSSGHQKSGLKVSISSFIGGSPGKHLTSKTSRWNGTGGLFGHNSTYVHNTFSTTSQATTEGQLILALKVLACRDFFPKQSKDRGVVRDTFSEAEDYQSEHLLRALRLAVVRYLDDFNQELRCEAAVTCLCVLDATVFSIDQNAEEYSFCFEILNRILMLAVGDDSTDIRARVFSAFTPSLDHLVVQSSNVHCLIEALNDESIEVRASAMSVLARAAHYDALHIMPVVRLTMKRLMRLLQNTTDPMLRMESVQLLQVNSRYLPCICLICLLCVRMRTHYLYLAKPRYCDYSTPIYSCVSHMN